MLLCVMKVSDQTRTKNKKIVRQNRPYWLLGEVDQGICFIHAWFDNHMVFTCQTVSSIYKMVKDVVYSIIPSSLISFRPVDVNTNLQYYAAPELLLSYLILSVAIGIVL